MKKIFIAILLATASCRPGGISSTPAPCAASAVDEQGFVLALQTFDVLLTSVDRLQLAGVIVGGSPRAIQIADAIHSAKLAFQAASAAQKVCNSGDYFSALTQAHSAVAKLSSLIKG
jgi:hypothetical protein